MDSPRRLRAKERKHYSDEGIDDDEIEGKRSFDVLDKLQSEQYNGDFVETLTGADFTLEYVQRTGMSKPIVIHDKTGLGMRIPSTSFKVSDVKQCVGSRRMLDVMDVNTQKGLEMSMKEWVKYYENENRDRLLNVISLEFSHTRLETYVESPTVVRQVDWVDSVWPRHLKEIHTEATNIIEKMKYPKVQKYCLMSVAGCFTDFHVDFGGTSVWYHILHGEKVFWLIPPTEENMEMYENWVLSGKQSDVFLADTVSDCQKIVLKAGYTFMIPSGWIHAVYTPKDSLVFGGNFIHSFNILQQLRVSEMEDRTRVPQKFRYPFYTEVMWYVLAQYLRCLSGKSYLHSPGKENSVAKNGPVKSEIDDNETDNKPTVKSENDTDNVETKMSNGLDSTPGTPRPGTPRPNRRGAGSRAATPVTENGDAEESSFSGSASKDKLKNENSPKGDGDEANSDKWVHLTPYELKGLTKLIEWLENLPASKRGVPKDVIDAEVLIDDIKALLVKHASDDHSKAITGQEVIKWPPSATKLIKPKPVKQAGGGKPGKLGKNAAGNRRRRTRCKKCPACMRGDCGECHFCKDMKKFGGPGRMKQSCISKKCMAPELPNSATCIICETDERVQNDSEEGEGTATTLMECGVCWEIVHPACLSERYTGLDNEGVINEDLPNSWECPKCSGNVDPSKLKISPKAKSAKGSNSEEEGEEADAPESGSSEEEAEDTKKGNKKLHSLEGKRVTSKVGSISKLKSVSLGTKRGKMKQAIMLSTSLKKKAVVPTKIKPVTKTKAPPKVEPRGLKSPPVVTRSGRTVVAKRAPDEDDDMFFSPIKRQRKEELSVSPVRGKGRGKRGLGSSPGATGRGQGMRVRSLNETATPGSRGGKSRGRGRGGRGGASASASQSTRISSSPSDSNRSSRAGTPLRGDKNSPSESGKGKKQKTPAKGQTAATTTTTSEEKPPEKEVKIIPPKYVIRPVPIPPPADFLDLNDGEKHQLPRTMWLKVFRYLHHSDLARCMSVCKNWNRWCINKSLWYELDLSHKKIKQVHLVGIVRRQPTVLNLNYAVIAPKQLSWLTERLPHLKNLSLAYCSWATLAALCCSSCPFLTYLDLSWASGLKDACFIDLISPAPDSRPAVRIVSRLHKLVELQMAGTDISDDSLQLVPKQLTNLQKLDLSYCIKLTNQAIEYLTDEGTATRYNLKELDLTGCNQLTADCLTFLANCPNLVRLKLKACHKICVEDCQAFTMTYVHRKLTLRDDFDKLIVCAETEEPMET